MKQITLNLPFKIHYSVRYVQYRGPISLLSFPLLHAGVTMCVYCTVGGCGRAWCLE